ncbi:MAG: VOC family protein [Actinomycetota bacterium]
MRLEGIHHITAITGDAPANVEFYAGLLGLRMVKKTVNQDDPTVYHLFYADELGSPGADLTFFEYPGVPRGRAGDGMVHRVVWRVEGRESLDFWQKRLEREGIAIERSEESLVFADGEGLALELTLDRSGDPPLRAEFPDVPKEYAIRGFEGARAYSSAPEDSAAFFEQSLGFVPAGDAAWTVRGDRRGSWYRFDPPPGVAPRSGAGTVHHIAWASQMGDHAAWRARVAEGGMTPTPIIDRFWFRSIYFREPSGVLFEIATLGPGFTVDEDLETLGERLVLPPRFEPLRDRLEEVLTPLPDPRKAARTASAAQ